MSIRDQERREREVERRINERMRRADREVGKKIDARAHAADQRKVQVQRRIEMGDVQPRPLPGLREDSEESLPSMESMPSMDSMKSIESADYATEVGEEAQQAAEAGDVMMKDMPVEGQPVDPEAAHEDLAQRVTEDTDSGGDPHLHNERKADEMFED